MKLLAMLLLLGMFSLSVAEVVDSFTQTCPQFFIKDDNNRAVPPTVFKAEHYVQICQFYGEYRFATLYDTNNRIPVYSAFTYTESPDQPFNDKGVYWKIEPQLDDPQTNREMKELKKEDQTVFLYPKQALPNDDYPSDNDDRSYTKGHLFPKSYGQSNLQKMSTYTLTNAAPQMRISNRLWGEQVEEPMLKKIKENCDRNCLVYIVTGVVPGDMWLPRTREGETIEKRVNIPSYFWTVFSCKPKKNNNEDSRAYIAKQITDLHSTALSVEELSVKDLNRRLGILYNVNEFSVFGNIEHKKQDVIGAENL